VLIETGEIIFYSLTLVFTDNYLSPGLLKALVGETSFSDRFVMDINGVINIKL